MVQQTRDELLQHLRTQLGFLRTSGEAFDDGNENEAVRLAVSIRVLVHDTQSAHSLLGQLGEKDNLAYVDTTFDILPGNLIPTNGLAMLGVSVRRGRAKGQYAAPLDNLPPPRLNKPPKPFDDWWNSPIIRDSQDATFSREDLVLALAHKEGGAHVDPELEVAYAALSRSNSLGWILVDQAGTRPLYESPVPASVRQIAFELQTTIEEQLGHLV